MSCAMNYVYKQTDRQTDRQTDYNHLLPFQHESMECSAEEYVLSQEIYRVLQCLQVPKQMGILKMVESGNWLTTDKIVQRIIENR